MTSRKIIIIAIFALALMFLFLALFGNKSYFRTQEVIEKNTELEGKIQEVSYQNARMGSVKDYTANGDMVFANDPDAFQETGYELFSSMTKPYKIFIVIVFTSAAMLVVGALIVIKNYKKTREEYEARELERKAKGEDQIFENWRLDKKGVFFHERGGQPGRTRAYRRPRYMFIVPSVATSARLTCRNQYGTRTRILDSLVGEFDGVLFNCLLKVPDNFLHTVSMQSVSFPWAV